VAAVYAGTREHGMGWMPNSISSRRPFRFIAMTTHAARRYEYIAGKLISDRSSCISVYRGSDGSPSTPFSQSIPTLYTIHTSCIHLDQLQQHLSTWRSQFQFQFQAHQASQSWATSTTWISSIPWRASICWQIPMVRLIPSSLLKTVY
jgi:hypothetical protein